MKDVGIVTLISVIAVAAAPTPPPSNATAFATMKSTDEFAQCFAQTQDRHSVPWWFVPKERGGTFSDMGAASGGKPYLLVINDRGGRRELLLQNATRDGPEAKAVKQCM
jgi:hypothetical protein